MPRYTDDQIIEALRKSGGLAYSAARLLGCPASTVLRRINKSAKLKAVQDEERGRFLDVGELKLKEAVMRGEPWAVKFLLSTLGKNRGYTERHEHTGVDGDPVAVEVTLKLGEKEIQDGR